MPVKVRRRPGYVFSKQYYAKPSVREAIRIASLPQHAFDARMESGEFNKQQVRDAQLLRAELMRKRDRADHVDNMKPDREEGPKMLTSAEKAQRLRDWRTQLDRNAVELAQREGLSRSAAEEQIVSNLHRLEKLDKEFMFAKLGGGRLPQQQPGSMLTSFNPPGDPNTVEPAERVLARIAAQLRAADPGMTVAQATLRASEHPEFVRVNRADQERRMIKASRFYG